MVYFCGKNSSYSFIAGCEKVNNYERMLHEMVFFFFTEVLFIVHEVGVGLL